MDDLKKYWPWALGIVGAIFVYYKFSAPATTSSSSGLSAMLAAQTAANAQASQASIAQSQIAAQSQASQNAAAVAETNANASLAQATGQSLSQVIAAQSAIPAMALNAASAQNQAALQYAAQTAQVGIAALPASMNAQANQLASVNNQFGSFANTISNATSNAIQSNAVMVGGAGQNATNSQMVMSPLIAQRQSLQAQQNMQNTQLAGSAATIGMLALMA